MILLGREYGVHLQLPEHLIISARYSHLLPEKRLSVVEHITGIATAQPNRDDTTKRLKPGYLQGILNY